MKKILFLTFLSISFIECARSLRGRRINEDTELKVTKNPRLRNEILENLFNIYDPSFLALVWPKISNGVHLSVGVACWEDISEFFRDLSEGKIWAYDVVDASGRYPSGLFSGNHHWLGSKEQCFKLDNEFENRKLRPHVEYAVDLEMSLREKYFDDEPCIFPPPNSFAVFLLKGLAILQYNNWLQDKPSNVLEPATNVVQGLAIHEWNSLAQRRSSYARAPLPDNCPPHGLAYTALTVLLNTTRIDMAKSFEVTLGVCLPRSCTSQDIASVINFSIMINDKIKTNKTIPRIAKIIASRQIKEHHDIGRDLSAIILICITAILSALVISATIVEMKLIKCRPHSSKSMSFDLQKYNTNSDSEQHCMGDETQSHKNCEVLSRKEANVLDTETLTINNMNNTSNINMVTVKKVMKPNAMPPSITLDVVSAERGSCNRCGKYKKQCSNPSQSDNLASCPRANYNSYASLSTISTKSKFFKSLFLSFSLTNSWVRIFNTNMANKDLSIIHVLRVFATFWIIFIHVATVVSYLSENKGDFNENNSSAYYIIATGTLAFDAIYFVSATFSSYHFFYLNRQYSVEELVSFGGTCGQLMQLICFVVNRVIRLLPSYGYAVLLTTVLARVSHDTAALSLPESDHKTCGYYWWRNLLYVTLFYPKEQQCMQISWYLSLETCLHAVCVLLCCVARWWRVAPAAALAVAALLASTAADVAAFTPHTYSFVSSFEAYATLIERPWARVTPYLVGIFVGWLVHRIEGKLGVSRVVSMCLWTASVSGAGALLAGPWAARAWTHAWLHAALACALLWPAIACSANKCVRSLVESPVLAALSRLSYGMLLLHGAAARLALLAAAGAGGLWATWSYFAGTALLSMFGALLLSLLIEMPCCSLLRRISDFAAR